MAYVDKEKFKRKLQYIFKTYRMSEIITEKVKKALDDTTVDVVEVVRCKDCKNVSCKQPNGIIHCFRNHKEGTIFRRPDDFCSYGERKEK